MKTDHGIPDVKEYVKHIVSQAPPLTVEQCAFIRAQLGPFPGQKYTHEQQNRDKEILMEKQRAENLRRQRVQLAQADLDRANQKFQDAITGCRGCAIAQSKHHFANPPGSAFGHEFEPMTPAQVADVAAGWVARITEAEDALRNAKEVAA